MTRLLLIIPFLSIFSACRQNLLSYDNKQQYNVKSFITRDSIFTLHQNVLFAKPKGANKDLAYTLSLTFLDFPAAKQKGLLNLEADTAILRVHFGASLAHDHNSGDNKVQGVIYLLDFGKDKVTLKENINVHIRNRKQTVRFNGKPSFTRQ